MGEGEGADVCRLHVDGTLLSVPFLP